MTRIGSIVGGGLMATLLAYGLVHAIPSKQAASSLVRGREFLEHGDYEAAEQSLDAVLRLVPESAEARQGLACAFYLDGNRSAATLELTHGLKSGVFAGHLGWCKHGLRLEDVFFVAKLGSNEAFAVPKVAGAVRFEEALTADPTAPTPEEPGRMLLGACLALRAGLLGVAWDYAGSALATGDIDSSDRAEFLSCFGQRRRRRFGCATDPSVTACVMTASARRAYFDDVRLVDWPTAPGSGG